MLLALESPPANEWDEGRLRWSASVGWASSSLRWFQPQPPPELNPGLLTMPPILPDAHRFLQTFSVAHQTEESLPISFLPAPDAQLRYRRFRPSRDRPLFGYLSA
jgi:hypothetical protein